MTGIGVRASRYLTELAARCAPLRADGSLGPSVTSDWYGGSAFATRVIDDCPSGQVVMRFDGRAGGVIDRIRAYCAPLQPWVLSGTTGATLSNHGGGGGGAWNDQCPAASVATGMDLDEEFFAGTNRITAFRVRCWPIRRCAWVGGAAAARGGAAVGGGRRVSSPRGGSRWRAACAASCRRSR